MDGVFVRFACVYLDLGSKDKLTIASFEFEGK
jgi:hypothetical protein